MNWKYFMRLKDLVFLPVLIPFLISAKTDTLNVVTDSTMADSAYVDSVAVGDTLTLEISKDNKDTDGNQVQLIFPEYANSAFSIGEKLTFRIRYGFIRAGTAVMQVKKELMMNERPVYHIQTTARSASTFSWIYEVKDEVNTFVDKFGFFSWRFEKRLREGNYHADLFVDYDPLKSTASVEYQRFRSEPRKDDHRKYMVNTPPFSYDVLAAFYFIRTQPLAVGKSIYLTNHDNKKVYNLEVKVYRKETVEVEAGTFRCLVVEPLLEGEGIFKQKGRMQIWLTDDQYKIPVQMKSEVMVGHITTELEKIEGGPKNIPALVAKND
jgi:hypothetical protein